MWGLLTKQVYLIINVLIFNKYKHRYKSFSKFSEIVICNSYIFYKIEKPFLKTLSCIVIKNYIYYIIFESLKYHLLIKLQYYNHNELRVSLNIDQYIFFYLN